MNLKEMKETIKAKEKFMLAKKSQARNCFPWEKSDVLKEVKSIERDINKLRVEMKKKHREIKPKNIRKPLTD